MTRFIATWFYSGLLRPAPGTWGSLASLPFIYLTLIWSWGVWHLIVISIFIFLLGWWATHNETKDKDDHDPSEIVIDEVLGQLITFSPIYFIISYNKATISYFSYTINFNVFDINYSVSLITIFLFAFGLFRFFDILKPWPISWADNKSTPIGVMLDDILAGIISAIILSGFLIIGYFL